MRLHLCEKCDNNDPKRVKVNLRMNLAPIVELNEDGSPVIENGQAKFKLHPVHEFPLRLPHRLYYEVECLNCSHTFKSYDRKYLGIVIDESVERTKNTLVGSEA